MWRVILIGMVIAAPALGADPPVKQTASAPADTVALRGGESGTVLEDMTIEGEDRIRVEYARPDLSLQIDPKSAPGLDRSHAIEVLDRGAPDPVAPFLALSALDRAPFRVEPWFSGLATGPVARFRPQIDGAVRWSLVVADSRGNTVASFRGDGKVPPEIPWDGLAVNGAAVLPGLVYSYVFEAYDRAGNKRSFLGDGFEIRPYMRRDKTAMRILFTGRDLGNDPRGATPSILVETAGWLNQIENLSGPIRLEARAQSLDQAEALADRATGGLKPLLLGDPARFMSATKVEPDAPDAGTIVITATL